MIHIQEFDVVIIGGGAAGCMAATNAKRSEPGLRVAVVDKSKIETSGSAGRGMDALNTVALPPYSYPEDVVELLTYVTEGVLDQEVAYTFGELCPGMVADLEKIMGRGKGDLFPVDEKGNYRLYYLHPTRKPMLLPMDGEEMKRALGHAVRESGVQVFDRTAAFEIVVRDGRVTGLMCFNIRTGHYLYLKTKAICLTAGSGGRMGLASSGYLAGCYEFPGNCGDGYTLAYNAGAELVNMECFQANSLLKDHQGPSCHYVAGPRGAYGVDRMGQRSPTHGYSAPDSKMYGWKTFAEGRGPTYLKIDHLPEKTIQVIEKIQHGNERTSRGLFHKLRGQDYRQPQSVELSFVEEIGVCGGHSSCGINSDKHGASNIPGLYVAGDVDGGLPQSYLGGALAMGGLIGRRSAEFAASHDRAADPDALKAWLKKRSTEFEAPLHRDRGLPTNQVEYKARTRIQYYLKPPKNPCYLEIAAWWMNRIRTEDVPRIKARDYHDLLKVYEIECITTVGEMMAKSSLFRDESRWGYHHWRVDIPTKKPEWEGTWTVVGKDADGQMSCHRKKCPPRKWGFPVSVPYRYPKLEYDVGPGFDKGTEWKNPERDEWMEAHLEAQGMNTPRRFMPQEEG